MLKTMRKNIQSLKSILWIVVATFILSIFMIWGGAGRLGESSPATTIVALGKYSVSVQAFQQALRNRAESIKTQYQEVNRAFLEQLNLPQQVLQGLVEQSLVFGLADEMGIRASDDEVAARVTGYPGLQRDGKFIGYDQYKRVLQMNRISVGEFEDNVRKDIVLSKTIQLLTTGVTTTPDEVWENYKKTKETAKLEYLVLETSKVTFDKKPETAELTAYFEKNKDKYKIPEKREGLYVFLRNDDLKKEVELGESEIESYYRDNKTQFQNPEKTKVSRVYLPFAGKDKALVQAEGQSVLDKAKAGQDFAALAKTYSKDDKAKDGGDYGYYDWASLSQAERDAVAKLQAGQVSGLVTLEAGLALLKVTEKTPASETPLAEAKPQIRSILLDQKARALATQRITALDKAAKKEKSLDAAAQKANFKVLPTGLLKSGEALGDQDPSGSISAALFGLKEKEISAPIYTYSGVALAEFRKSEAPRAATFDEVKTTVETDLSDVRKKEAALARIQDARSRLTDKNWEDIAQKYKLEIKTVAAHQREQYIGIIGENKDVDRLAFSLPLNKVSDPVVFETGTALLRVLERKEATKPEFEKEKETESANLLEQKKNEFLQSYLAKLRAEKNIKVKYDLYLKTANDVLARYETEK
jgi:peptidyl-prolyl cis-trans isomerase D